MLRLKKYTRHTLLLMAVLLTGFAYAQEVPQPDPPVPMPELGPNDTIPVPALLRQNEWLPGNNLEWIYVQAPMPAHLKKKKAEWTRLRNAVYVTYPYAKKAGAIMNDINQKLVNVSSSNKRKTIIKEREKELKKE